MVNTMTGRITVSMAKMNPVIPKLNEFSFRRSQLLQFSAEEPWAIFGVRLFSENSPRTGRRAWAVVRGL